MKRSHATGGTLTRRSFLAGAAAMAGGLAACRTSTAIPVATGGAAPVPRKLNLAVIGAGGRGADNIKGLAATGAVNIVALCDCDSRQAGEAFSAVSERRALFRLAPAARRREGHRCRGGVHARPQPRRDFDCRDAARQACLLREAARAQHLGGARDGACRRRAACGDPDGHTGARVRGHAARRGDPASRRHRRRHGASRLDRPARGLVAARSDAPRRHAASARGARLGRVAWPRARHVRTTPPMCRSNGAASGTSAPAPSATWASTTWIPPSGASSSARRRRLS